MIRRTTLAAFATLLLLASTAHAQAYDEIVVTAHRMTEPDARDTPQVTLKKRADYLLTEVRVVCDTRDLSQRKAELRATLHNMIKAAAQDPRIELGVGDEVVGSFGEGMIEKAIAPDAKVDTSRATLLIKTAVTAADTFDAATGRINTFVERTAKVGRTEIIQDNDWQLSIVGPNQYRPQVAKLVAEDALRMSALFGEGYGVEVSGLQLPVSWYQAGPLDLALFIPYKLTVRPLH